MTDTLAYYKEHAQEFCSSTEHVDMAPLYKSFEAHLKKDARVLDLGCGVGRDSLYFIQQGYSVVSVDGSPEMCAYTKERTQGDVRCMLFEDLKEQDTYDGIWACASLLHLSLVALPKVLEKINAALKDGGILYMSFKYGTFEGERNGRFFKDLTEDELEKLLKGLPEFHILDLFQTQDARPDRSDRWLNVYIQKKKDTFL